MNSHAADVWYAHSSRMWDWFTEYKDFGDGFRADDGFVPQVGFRENYGEAGYTFRPTGLFSRIRTFFIADYQAQQDGSLIFRSISPGVGMDGRWSSFMRYRVAFDRVRAGNKTFPRRQFIYTFQVSPNRAISLITLDGFLGEQVDFANSRLGTGGTVNLTSAICPTDHLELRFNGSRQWLNVDTGAAGKARLFTASVARLRATYTFTARAFARAIAQYIATDRDPSLYISAVDRKDGSWASSLLFAYKLDWQSVVFLGYGDNRTLVEDNHYEKADRQFFLKVSYAFQR